VVDGGVDVPHAASKQALHNSAVPTCHARIIVSPFAP